MKILVIQQKMIGDVLTSSIICRNVTEFYPNATVDYLVNSNTSAVVENNPFVDEFIFFTPTYRKNKRALYKFLKSIKQKKYDVVIDAYGKTESNLITFFSKAKIKISYYKWYTQFLYTHSIKRKTKSSIGLALENRLQLLESLFKDKNFNFYKKPEIYLKKDEITHAQNFLKSHKISKPIIMIGALGSSKKKTYPLEYMASVINEITEKASATLLFNFIPSQQKEVQKLYDLCNEKAKKSIRLDVYTKSLRDFLGVLYHCNALIGNEGGAVNMAKALNIPTFSIFSPWIKKESWHLFEDDKNIAIHLKDVKPELFESKSKKEIKKNVESLYTDFKPSYFKSELNRFLTTILSID